MREQARAWFVWLKKQIGADGFRFDAVKHYPAYVVEDLLYNAMGDRIDYFAVGEFVGGRGELDHWADETRNRAGTFDFAFRDGLANIVEGGGLFDMGSLPNYQQANRLKTVPFVNNHDTWRGAFWDSESGSNAHDDRSGDWRQNGSELAPTIDPGNARTDVAYAAAFAIDGSPMVYYEDLFVNHGPDRFRADPDALPVRDYVANLVWAHQKLDFKDGAYKVRYQGSPDLLVIERSGKGLIGLNDHGSETLSAWVQTDFGPNSRLHDYSGATGADLTTDQHGWVRVSVPPMSYAVWGRAGIQGGFSPPARRTTQEFQMADDLGDPGPASLGYGGRVVADTYRVAGAVWAAADTPVRISVYTDQARDLDVRLYRPDAEGGKSRAEGSDQATGVADAQKPLVLEVDAKREGYHLIALRLTGTEAAPVHAYVKVEYQAPAVSGKF